MAFSTNKASAAASVNTSPRGRGRNGSASDNDQDWERAGGFINLYLPTKAGNRRKLGAIPLKESVANEKLLLDWLKADPEGNAAKVLSMLQIEFRTSEPDPNAAFDLPA